MLGDIVKSLFGDSDYGQYHKYAWGYFILGNAAVYISPIVSLPVLAIAGYNFVQVARHHKQFLYDVKQEKMREWRSRYE